MMNVHDHKHDEMFFFKDTVSYWKILHSWHRQAQELDDCMPFDEFIKEYNDEGIIGWESNKDFCARSSGR